MVCFKARGLTYLEGVFRKIERKDGKIRVLASDNVMVTKVQVKLLDPDGKTLEEGAAAQADSGWWEYGSSPLPASPKYDDRNLGYGFNSYIVVFGGGGQ